MRALHHLDRFPRGIVLAASVRMYEIKRKGKNRVHHEVIDHQLVATG
jgi:hypothetical protein